MTGIALTVLVSLAILALVVYQLVSRGLQMRELCDHGIETTGIVTSKRRTSVRQGRTEKLAYEYLDQAGQPHSHTSVVSISVYQDHPEGQPIQVVYSSRQPQISAPLYLVELSRKALNRA
ncbi:DUF3592 domain-containing protein [Prosthecobacter sp. SYSU 5D2]|uniref:DUF3592 domain-containing protein n=1 Tax=Prosthecobacter sp. SYSU 5D2 TaxID=3134134 RepID=UPI0031FEBDE0